MKLITLLALVLTLNACSFSDSKKEEVGMRQDDLEFAVDTIGNDPANTEFKVEEQKIAENNESIGEDAKMPIVAEADSPGQEPPMVVPEEPKFSEFQKTEDKVMTIADTEPAAKPVPVESPAKINIDYKEPNSNYGQIETYKFQKGDTLMMVAFKIYGDYRKWKEIRNLNKDKKKIVAGTELKYYVPEQKFGWKPDGNPYLVKTGDTLGIISKDKYGTVSKWKSIYENNRPLIRNPNLIFAGFTIYYKPVRNLASEKK
jgi:nucleoid-associated protein YgaU